MKHKIQIQKRLQRENAGCGGWSLPGYSWWSTKASKTLSPGRIHPLRLEQISTSKSQSLPFAANPSSINWCIFKHIAYFGHLFRQRMTKELYGQLSVGQVLLRPVVGDIFGQVLLPPVVGDTLTSDRGFLHFRPFLPANAILANIQSDKINYKLLASWQKQILFWMKSQM